MSKALLLCLCIVLSLLGGITGLTSFSSEAQAQGDGIIVEDAEYVSTNMTTYSADLLNIAKNVTPRIIIEYGESISKLNLYESDDLNQIASMVSSRIIVEYANSIFEYGLQGSQNLLQVANTATPRIIVEYADSVFTKNLERPPAPLTSPPITNISLSGVLGRGGWFTSNVQVNMSANIPVEKTEYSFDNVTWINYTTPFTITNEGYTQIYYRSIDKAGNIEITKSKTVKIDKTSPSGYILINNGEIYTTSKYVTLTLNATDAISGISQMRFSNYYKQDFAWTSWEPFALSKNWTLAIDWQQVLQTQNVTMYVYVQYMDNAGLVSTFFDTIILSVKIPTPVVLNNPSDITASSVVLAWSRNNNPDFLCYQVLWNVEPLEPSTGYLDDSHYFEEMTGTLIYNQSVVSYQLKGLRSSTTYYFIVRTFNQQRVYSDSNSASITTASNGASGMIPWPLDTFFWLFGAIIAVCAMGLATRARQSTRTLRRILMAIIIFGLSFTIYYPIAQRPAYASDSLRDSFYLEFAIVLLVTFLFSALEKGLGWPFIFGNSLTWGLVFGYNFFFGYPYWLIVLYLIVEGLFFGFLYVFLGAVGQSFIGWVRNRKISAQLRARAPTNVPAPLRASTRSVLAKKIRCRKCGHAIPDTDEYCVYCGVRLKKRIF